ncbi:MAG TPA: non-heme iron oxygenase ferredoxin subunit [Candidatus Sulfotelmatobacter sp.]|nr:non-heme iron oxygenase ferredoxin subunit [Candidatus Sulfotelmatobacter sp.]
MASTALARLCAADEVPVGEIRQATLPGGLKVAVYNVDGRFYVTADECTHGASSLSEEGTLIGNSVECGWHFGSFDVITGEATAMPCQLALRTFEVVVVEGAVCVKIDGVNTDAAKR